MNQTVPLVKKISIEKFSKEECFSLCSAYLNMYYYISLKSVLIEIQNILFLNLRVTEIMC